MPHEVAYMVRSGWVVIIREALGFLVAQRLKHLPATRETWV